MYKSTLNFDGTQKLKDITIKSGSYSATYKIGIDDPSGTIPQADCQSEVDMVYTFTFTNVDSDYYIMSVTFKQPLQSTSTTSTSITAAAWSTAGIILESTGYQPLDLTDAQVPLQFVEKSAHLYAWTNSNASGETYYAWKRDYDNAYYYTLSQTPSFGDQLYDKVDGSIVETTEYVGLSQYDSSTNPPRIKIYDLADSDWYYRDTTKDIIDNPQTIYTDSTTLTTGMTLYDNTGTDTGLTVGTINQDGSFDISSSMYYCWKLYRLGPSSSPAPFQGNHYCYSTTEEPSVGDLVYTGTSETAEITGYTTGDLQFTQYAEVAHYARYSDYDTTDLNAATFYENESGVVPIDK